MNPKAGRKAGQPETRASAGLRLRALLSDAGLSVMQTAKLFQVTPRTVHNWRSGCTQPPGAVLRLLRLMAGRELGVPGWEGWRMHSGKLWTPEGHRIEPQDGAWWSLLVRQARAFRVVYRQLCEARQSGYSGHAYERVPATEGAPLAGVGPAPGEQSSARSPMVITGITQDNWDRLGAIMTPWPSISDFLLPSKPTQRHGANGSASASTPSSAWPSMGTCEASKAPQSPYSPLGMLEPSNGLPSLRRPSPSPRNPLPEAPSRGACSPPSGLDPGPSRTPIQSRSLAPSRPERTASGWPSGVGGTRASPEASPEVQP